MIKKKEEMVEHCPNCDNRTTIPQKRFDFRIAWNIIKEMKSGQEIIQMNDVFIKLELADTHANPENFLTLESPQVIPNDVKEELDEKIQNARTVLNQDELIETLKTLNVRMRITTTAVRSQ